MIRRAALVACLLTALPVSASHQWAGVDLCEVRKDWVPPGLPLKAIPEPDSEGAGLLQRYCVQCHKLPGPGRHTAAEWPEVISRMQLLMDVTRRFGMVLGKIEVPSELQQAVLLAYLQNNALIPMPDPDSAPAAYREACGGCHALPDPASHSARQWPTVLKRMERNDAIMGRAAMAPEDMGPVRNLLGVPRTADDSNVESPIRPVTNRGAGSWLALGPFMLMVLFALYRWHRGTPHRQALE